MSKPLPPPEDFDPSNATCLAWCRNNWTTLRLLGLMMADVAQGRKPIGKFLMHGAVLDCDTDTPTGMIDEDLVCLVLPASEAEPFELLCDGRLYSDFANLVGRDAAFRLLCIAAEKHNEATGKKNGEAKGELE